MTNEEAIKVIEKHSQHWHRLLKEGVCSVEEGVETIEAFNAAKRAFRTLERLEKITKNCESGRYISMYTIVREIIKEVSN